MREIYSMYEVSFAKLSERFFKGTTWPPVEFIASLVDHDHVFCLLYKVCFPRSKRMALSYTKELLLFTHASEQKTKPAIPLPCCDEQHCAVDSCEVQRCQTTCAMLACDTMTVMEPIRLHLSPACFAGGSTSEHHKPRWKDKSEQREKLQMASPPRFPNPIWSGVNAC